MKLETATRPLRAGDVMDADEFLRRWDAEPNLKLCELIDGVVHTPSPVSWVDHGEPDNCVQCWLGNYKGATPGTSSATNVTCRLSDRNVMQPDSCIGILEGTGGNLRFNERGQCVSAPELVAEVAAARPRSEVLTRFTSFCGRGSLECVAVYPRQRLVEWYDRGPDGSPVLRPPPEDGVYRSAVFAGLWLNAAAVAAGDVAGVLATLQFGLGTAAHAAFVAELARRRAGA